MKPIYFTFIFFFTSFSPSFSQPKKPTIVESLLPEWNGARRLYRTREDTVDAKINYRDSIDYVMLHFCSVALTNPQNPYDLQKVLQQFKRFGVSSHYIIDRDGTIHHLVPDSMAAYHAGIGYLAGSPECRRNKMNDYSIGIEMLACGTKEELKKLLPPKKKLPKINLKPDEYGFTKAQYQSLDLLLQDILQRYPKIPLNRQHIIGHSEYTNRRTDPGKLFEWSKIGL